MNLLDKFLGINWRTTLAGVGVIVLAAGRIANAYRTKDIPSMVTDSQLVMETLTAVIVGLGLVKAKDQNVSGTGSTAVSVNDSGVVTNRDGKVVGQQAPNN